MKHRRASIFEQDLTLKREENIKMQKLSSILNIYHIFFGTILFLLISTYEVTLGGRNDGTAQDITL